MKECTRHRDAVIRYGAYHDRCPLCKILQAAREVERHAGLHTCPRCGWMEHAAMCVEVDHVDAIFDALGPDEWVRT